MAHTIVATHLSLVLNCFHPHGSMQECTTKKILVWLILGSTVEASEILQLDDIPMEERTLHFELYYERDKKMMKKFGRAIAEK